jgi:hypothetical protein
VLYGSRLVRSNILPQNCTPWLYTLFTHTEINVKKQRAYKRYILLNRSKVTTCGTFGCKGQLWKKIASFGQSSCWYPSLEAKNDELCIRRRRKRCLIIVLFCPRRRSGKRQWYSRKIEKPEFTIIRDQFLIEKYHGKKREIIES